MGRYDQNRYRKPKRSRYGTDGGGAAKPANTSRFSAFVVGVLLVVGVALGFFLAKISDGTISTDALQFLSDLKKTGVMPPKSGQSQLDSGANGNVPHQAFPHQTQSDTLEFTSPQEQIILPALDSSDEPVRQALVAVDPALAPYLNAGQLIRKYMQIANDFSQGIRVEKHFDFLKLPQSFVVESREARLVMGEQSFQRYDGLAQAIKAIDVQGILAIYKKFRPLFLQVFAEFSYPDGHNLDDVFIKAAENVLSAPVMEQPIFLMKYSSYYKFVDPELEGLNPVHKQLVRMGAENTRIIQNKVRQLVSELVNPAE